MAVGVTIFIFLLVLQSWASQTLSTATGPAIQYTTSPATVASSSSIKGVSNISPWQSNVTKNLSTQTDKTTTHLSSVYYTSTTSMPVYTTNTLKITNGTNSSNEAITTTTIKTTTTATTYAPNYGSQAVISSTIIPTAISTENSTVSRTVTENANRTTHLPEISTEGSNLKSNVSTTITSSTAVSNVTSGTAVPNVTSSTAVSNVTSSTAVSNVTSSTAVSNVTGNEKEIKKEPGYDRDLVIIFGTMLFLMLVASIGYGIFKCKRRQKNRQFIEGGGIIHIATSKF